MMTPVEIAADVPITVCVLVCVRFVPERRSGVRTSEHYFVDGR